LAALGIARLPRALRVVAAGLILSPLIVPVIVVAIGIYLCLLALRAGRLADRPRAGPYLPRCSFRRDQRQRQPGGHRPPAGAGRPQPRRHARGTFFQVTAAPDPARRAGRRPVAFITSSTSWSWALFLSGSGAVTLPTPHVGGSALLDRSTIAAVSTLTIVLTVALLGGAHLLRRHNERMRTA